MNLVFFKKSQGVIKIFGSIGVPAENKIKRITDAQIMECCHDVF